MTFHQLLYYLYTDKPPTAVNAGNCVDLIELANRLCLPRLVTLVEATVIETLNEAFMAGEDISEEALKILQPCQVKFSADFSQLYTNTCPHLS